MKRDWLGTLNTTPIFHVVILPVFGAAHGRALHRLRSIAGNTKAYHHE
ncbi:Uncharacterised protein [Vibrio cholerae]|nr:Uncharacterised protein [Vibrio cholerae]